MSGRHGSTLPEMLIGMTLFMLALAMCGELAVTAVRSRSHAMDRNGPFRELVTRFSLLEQDLTDADRIYAPDLHDYAPHHPGSEAALAVALRQSDGSPGVVVWMLRGDEWQRQLYRPDFDPAVAASQVPLDRTLPQKLSHVRAFTIRQLPPGANGGAPLLQLEVTPAEPLHETLVTCVSLDRI